MHFIQPNIPHLYENMNLPYTLYSYERHKNRLERRVIQHAKISNMAWKTPFWWISSVNTVFLATRTVGQLKALRGNPDCILHDHFTLFRSREVSINIYSNTKDNRLGKALEEAEALEQKPWHFLFSPLLQQISHFFTACSWCTDQHLLKPYLSIPLSQKWATVRSLLLNAPVP